MGVVYLRDRITNEGRIFESNSSSDKSLLFVDDLECVEAFSVEFSVGESWSEKYGPHNTQMYRISDEQGVSISRHGSIVVEVVQNIRVPHNMYGVVVPTGSLFLDRGIIIAAAKIEPSFNGKLKLRLFNTTSYRHVLRRGDKLASGIFFSTEVTRYHAQVEKRRLLIDKKLPLKRRITRWLRANQNQIMSWIVTAVFSSLSAVVVSYYLLQPKVQSPAQSTPSNAAQPPTNRSPKD